MIGKGYDFLMIGEKNEGKDWGDRERNVANFLSLRRNSNFFREKSCVRHIWRKWSNFDVTNQITDKS